MNGPVLRVIRERSGYTLRQLSEASGIPKSTIAYLEQGDRTPSPSTVKALAGALRVPLVALLGPVGEEE